MDEKLPDNVSPHKDKKPKGWSYPVKTTDLVECLDLGSLGKRIEIWYDNSPNRPYKSVVPRNHFNILSVTWYGHFASRRPSATGDEPYFTASIKTVKPEYRQRLLAVLRDKVFPDLKKWMADIQRTPTINTYFVEYDEGWEHLKLPTGIVVKVNKDMRFVVPLDLDKKDGENQG